MVILLTSACILDRKEISDQMLIYYKIPPYTFADYTIKLVTV